MTQRVGLLNGTNITYDKDLTAGLLATTNQWVIEGLGISWSGASANVLPWKALIECIRTNGEKVMVFFENTANVVVDLTGTKKLYVLVSQAKIDDGSSNALDGTGIGSIQTGASYPAWDYIPLASITGGVITDERVYITHKPIKKSWYITWKKDAIMIIWKSSLPIINWDFSIGSGSTNSWWVGQKSYWWYNWGGGYYDASFDSGRLKLTSTYWPGGGYVECRNTDGGYYGVTPESIAVEPNTTYTLEFDMETQYISWDSNNGASINVLLSDSTGTIDQIWYTPWWIKTTTSNTHYSKTFTTTANHRFLNISPIIYAHTWTWNLRMNAWFDNITITCASTEIQKEITIKNTINSSDKFIVEYQDWSIGEFTYWNLMGAISWASVIRIPVVFAEASGSAWKVFSIESQAYAYTPTWEVQMGSTAVTTKVAIPFYHSWVSTTSLKSYLRKVWTPTDNMVIRIETDSWDAPSGTLVHANATFNVSWASLTTSHAVITWSMTSWTATRGTKLWIVFSRQNSVDINNYYMIGTIPLDTRVFMWYKLWNTSWSGKTPISIYFESTACEKYIAVLAGTASGRTKVSWFSDGTYSIGWTWYLSAWSLQSVTGVTKSNYYSLSATSWDLQITPVSTQALWYCPEDGQLVLMWDVLSIPWYFYQNAIADNTAFGGQQIRAQFYCKSWWILEWSWNTTMSFNSGGWSYSLWIFRAGAWVSVASWSKVFAWEQVWFIVNWSNSWSNYIQFDWNIRFTPSF